jgi:hypothetical protein
MGGGRVRREKERERGEREREGEGERREEAAYVSIRQQTRGSIRQHTSASLPLSRERREGERRRGREERGSSIRQHTSAYVSRRETKRLHTCMSIR